MAGVNRNVSVKFKMPAFILKNHPINQDGFLICKKYFLHVFFQLFHQFSFCDWYTHDLIVSFCIYKINITDDLYKLAIIDLRHHYSFIISQDLTQIFWKWTQITQVCMRNRMTLTQQLSNCTFNSPERTAPS